MAEPTSAKSFYELVRKVAEFVGMAYYGTDGAGRAMAPTDLHDLDVCTRIVNNAIQMFIDDAPQNGWRWQHRIMSVNLKISFSGTADGNLSSTTLSDASLAGTYDDDYYNNLILEITGGTGIGETALITDYTGSTGKFTFSGGLSGGSTPDATTEFVVGARYKLADNFSGTPDGEIHYARESNRGTPITWRSESEIRAFQENTDSSGNPTIAAIRAYGTRQWELLVWPRPTAAVVVEFPYTLFFDDRQLATGVATGGTAGTLVDTTNRDELDDAFNDWILTIRAGTGVYETATITDYDQGTSTLSFSALSGGSTPDTTSVYSLEPASNLHPAGFPFDNTILTACLARTEMEIEDINAGWANQYYNICLPAAYRRDSRSAPRKLGYFGGGKARQYDRVWKDVDTTNI